MNTRSAIPLPTTTYQHDAVRHGEKAMNKKLGKDSPMKQPLEIKLPRCCARVSTALMYSSRQCSRAAKVQRGDKFYCNQHDPVVLKAKAQKQNEEFERKWEERQASQLKGRMELLMNQRKALAFDNLFHVVECFVSDHKYGLGPDIVRLQVGIEEAKKETS
jgi:hypothetical protein